MVLVLVVVVAVAAVKEAISLQSCLRRAKRAYFGQSMTRSKVMCCLGCISERAMRASDWSVRWWLSSKDPHHRVPEGVP